MRPLKLTLRGINSYRKEQTIDFEALTSAGLFGIFGPTGSGKSSILDAITLALYARLPRSTKNFININEETAAVSFLFSISDPLNGKISNDSPIAQALLGKKKGETVSITTPGGKFDVVINEVKA